MKSGALSPDEQVLAAATKAAIAAAGGLAISARETGLSDSQLSRCCSPWQRDSITLRDAVTIEQLGHGHDGHPHLLRAHARILGFLVVAMPQGPEDPDGLMRSVAVLTGELGDVARAIAEGLADRQITPAEAEAAERQLDDLDQASAALRHKLHTVREVRDG